MNFLLRRSDDNALSLSQASFDLMLTDQLGKTLGPNLMAQTMGDEASNQVFSIGLGVFLEKEAESITPENYDYLGWSGAYNTHFWIDPKSQVAGIFMTQIFPPVYRMTDQLENVADQFFAD
jgi:CubicO group peptidase (beta-lactamase class C family)